MEVLLGIGIALGGMALVLTIRSITTLFHELGHAIPALIFSKEKVNVYVGTYGKADQGFPIHLGRLSIFFRFNFLTWNIGMCSHGGIRPLWHNLITVIGGPIASLLISIPLLLFLVNVDLHPLTSFCISVFVMAASIDFFTNMIPSGSSGYTDDGNSIFNDGMQLKYLFRRLSLPEVYFEMEELIVKKEFVAAIETGRANIVNKKAKPEVYDLMIEALNEEREYEDIITASKLKAQHYPLTANDYHTMGKAYTKLNQFEDALKFLNEACYKKHDNADMLFDRGYLHLQRSDHQAAYNDFCASLHFNPNQTKSILYRALSLIRLDEPKDAIHDLEVIIKYEPENDVAWFYLGMAHEESGNDMHAFDCYTMAKQMGCKEHGLEYRLQLTSPE